MANALKRLEGKVAIITGGASGIGEASVRLFVENGAMVVIADIQDEKGTQLAQDVGTQVCVFRRCDVTLESDMEALVAFTVSKWGRLDIMYNNAGVLGDAVAEDVHNLDMADFDHVISVNVRGMALGVKYASKAMIDAGTKGVIICTASVSSVLAGMGPVAYTISKHAVLGLVRASSSDLGKYGIRVNCLSPWGVVTPLLVNHLRQTFENPALTADEVRASRDSHSNLQGHSLSAFDIARSALYLASDDSPFVSGLNLIVDGGFTATNHSFDS
ncbi:hypothetical protein L7F22_049803 [Adiantum nelumboides]|nr:hypothetical protein [Adiantum nelumboides]